MKLATLKDGSRDGQLVVVARDLKQPVSRTVLRQHCSVRWTIGISLRPNSVSCMTD
jgi:hypothetical protein